MPNSTWRVLGIVAVVVVIIVSVASVARANARADVHAERTEELRDSLDTATSDASRLTDEHTRFKELAGAQAEISETRIGELQDRIAELDGRVSELEAEERAYAATLEDALGDLAGRLDPEDLPYLRRVTAAQDRLVVALRTQIAHRDEQLAFQNEQIVLVRAELGTARQGWRASEALTDGLRAVIVEHERIDVEQRAEIDALRSAIAPSFFTNLLRNAGLVGGATSFGVLIGVLVR